MDDNARPHRARIVRAFLQQEALDVFQWPDMFPDQYEPNLARMGFIDRKVNKRIPQC